MRPDTLGILGGMGPLATADFLRKLVELTPVTSDQEHLPVLVANLPQIPDRVAPLLHGTGADPLPEMLRIRDLLIAAGARAIAMPCNTAHAWHPQLADCAVPFLHIVDATAEQLGDVQTVGLLGTAATLKVRLFDRLPVPWVAPDDAIQQDHVLPAIAAVKRAELALAERLLRPAIEHLLERSDRVVLACTEIPPVVSRMPEIQASCVDTTEALARACVRWGLSVR